MLNWKNKNLWSCGLTPKKVLGLLNGAKKALAALSQNATFPADIVLARKTLETAIQNLENE